MQPVIFCYDFEVSMDRGIDIKDITSVVKETVKRSKVRQGTVCVTAIGSTGSITTIEYEPGVIEDLKNIINEIAPPDRYYEHEMAWHDGNGHSHVQAAIIGPSETFSIRDSQIVLGTWQQIVVINHDIKPRKRRITLTVVGVK